MIPFKDTLTKSFGNVNHIAIMDEVGTFNRLVLPTGVILIDINANVGTRLSLEFQIIFCIHDMMS